MPNSALAMPEPSLTAETPDRPETTDRLPRDLVGSVIATAILAFLGLFLETVLNVLFPALMKEFSIDISAVSWMTSGYLLVVSIIMPISGWLQRRFSARNLFLVAVATVLSGAVLAALAANYPILLTGRILQGVGTAIATPLMFTTIMMRAPRAKVGMLMGMGALVLGTAPALGPTLGGVIGTFATWRLVFWMTVPLVLVSLGFGWRCLDADAPAIRPGLNVGELLLTGAAFTGLLLGVERTGALVQDLDSTSASSLVVVVALWAIGLISMAALVNSLLRSDSPLLHLSVLAAPQYRWSFISFGLLQFSALGLGYILPTVAQLGLGRSPLTAGLLVLPGTILGAVFAPLGGLMLDRLGARRPIIVGTGIALVGAVSLAVVGVRGGVWGLGIGYFIYMFGFALTYANTQTFGMQHVEHRLSPDATGLMNTWQQFAGALAMTVLSTIMALQQHGAASGSADYQSGSSTGAQVGMAVVAVVVALAMGCQLKAHRQR